MKITTTRVRIVRGDEDNGTTIRLCESDSGKLFVAEKDLRRAAKRLGCNLNETRLHSSTGYAIGTGRLSVRRVEPGVLTEIAVIGTDFFNYN